MTGKLTRDIDMVDNAIISGFGDRGNGHIDLHGLTGTFPCAPDPARDTPTPSTNKGACALRPRRLSMVLISPANKFGNSKVGYFASEVDVRSDER